MINIAICDDEAGARACLAHLIQQQGEPCRIAEYTSAEECLASGTPMDLLFIDVALPGADGTALARTIRALPLRRQPLLVFVTGHEDYVYDAFDVGALHYLLKPVDEARFAAVFRRALSQLPAEPPRMVTLRLRGGGRTLPMDSIICIEGSNHRVLLHSLEGTESCAGKIGALETELGEGFFRVHKGYLINLSHVESYTRTEVLLRGGTQAPISKYKYRDFVHAYLRFLRREAAL